MAQIAVFFSSEYPEVVSFFIFDQCLKFDNVPLRSLHASQVSFVF